MRRFFALALIISASSCSLFKKHKTAPPAVITPPSPAKAEPPKPLGPPPKVATQPAPEAEPPPDVIQTPTPSPPPRKRQPPRAQKKTARTAPAAAAPAPNPEPAAPAPQLTPIITPAEQQQLNQEIDASVRSAETALAMVAKARLSGQKRENLRRAQSFLKQAQEMRANDPATALTLAKRADALARDLASAVR